MLDVHVCIDVHDGVVAQFNAMLSVLLNGELAEGRTVIVRVVFGEIAEVGTKVDIQHISHVELEEQVGVDVQRG